ncbi:MFS transporter [Porticoccus sp. GXU_MW_L64]
MNKKLLLYALPVFCLAIMIGPAGSIIQGVYTREFGLKLSDIAFFIVICRFFDALTDPAIGLFSDRTRNRRGGRKTWIVAGTLVSIVACYFLYIPPENVTPFYFFIAFLFCYLGWTLIEIPHLAWGSELSRSYHERTRIFSYRMGLLFLGAFAFFALPLIIAAFDVVVHGVQWSDASKEYDGRTLEVAFWVLLVLFPLTLFFCLKYCPAGEVVETQERPNMRTTLKTLKWNKPLQFFVLAMAIFFIGNGMQVAVAYLHLSSYLGLAESAAIIYVVCFPLNIICIPLWVKLAKRIEKHRAYALGALMNTIGFVALGFIEPGESAFYQYLIVFGFLQMAQAAWWALPTAMLGDISDYGTYKSGVEQSATYYAVHTFMYKSFQGLGGAVAFSLAALFGFDPSLDMHDAESAFGIKAVMGFIPAILTFAVTILILYFPITAHRHGVIRKYLDKRQSRLLGKVVP